ncbi:carbohydrate kinase [Lihuaxuella thermophila]|uniref:Pseudouridine kinase n=1 Tax=Lihuaxuella thermophila TaxID=1173111 RepID=A0A1H8FBF5_9BACL|nr:carbohydrate kinase [Lihuaxuella thermophila]SEN28557.1 pseudouridine kinase [Lihuaxuella thermophila]
MDKEKQILHYIRLNPFISQQELADKVGISRSAVAGYIANLTKRGVIQGRAYVLRQDSVITCIGGANLDRKARSKQKVRFYSSNPVTITETCGGVARNVAENLGRLGCTVSLVTCVGDDKEGWRILEETKKHGVDVSQSWIMPSGQTGTYTALLDTDGEMIIALANMDIYEQLTPSLLRSKWDRIAASTAVFLDTNLPEESLLFIIRRCQEEGIPLYIDPVSAAKATRLPPDLTGTDTILPNREEAECLAGMRIENLDDCKRACEHIRQRGAKNIILTLGPQGVFFSSPEGSGHFPPFQTEIVDVTGAGDAFVSGFLYGIVQGEPLPRASQLGLAAAALALRTEHSSSINLDSNQLYNFLR